VLCRLYHTLLFLMEKDMLCMPYHTLLFLMEKDIHYVPCVEQALPHAAVPDGGEGYP
jgi:hypothetical protein